MRHIGFDGRMHDGIRGDCSRCDSARAHTLSEERAREVLRGNGNGQAPAAIDVRPDVATISTQEQADSLYGHGAPRIDTMSPIVFVRVPMPEENEE